MRFVVLALLFVGCGKPSGTSVAPNTSTVFQTPDIAQSAADLLAEYTANEIAGDAKYKGKVVATMGTVERISGENGPAVVRFSVKTNYIFCEFSPESAPSVMALKKGDMAIISGKCKGIEAGNRVFLTNCRLVKTAITPAEKIEWGRGNWKAD